ncbi:hypothetical protein [Desulfoscipio gibsoniae]|uniref:Uncharacterized protein n=1 Tax=Desulfoscipio gibsoniae DSM 7213 TaxID=767817 RepID=R4KGY6_9FIRM|nr:hypothetical protein [Desulfoscipio gibsoniae]AGL02458.1 hypothetical protein Desgi_3088 [Desulfoscipio gibsoniae DSM 7213]
MIVRLKKSTFLLLALALYFFLGGAALATANDSRKTLSPQWTNTTSVNVNLSFDDGKGTCGARVLGKSGVTKITGKVVLARKNSDGTYTAVKTWSNLKTTGEKLLFDKTYYVTTGYSYRLTITATVYRNGTGETVSGSYEAYAK